MRTCLTIALVFLCAIPLVGRAGESKLYVNVTERGNTLFQIRAVRSGSCVAYRNFRLDSECPNAGSIKYFFEYQPLGTAPYKCTLSVWHSGMFEKNWHMDFSDAPLGLCFASWGNGNTLNVTIVKPEDMRVHIDAPFWNDRALEIDGRSGCFGDDIMDRFPRCASTGTVTINWRLKGGVVTKACTVTFTRVLMFGWHVAITENPNHLCSIPKVTHERTDIVVKP